MTGLLLTCSGQASLLVTCSGQAILLRSGDKDSLNHFEVFSSLWEMGFGV